MGSLIYMLSIVEFQLHWVMKQPTKGCNRMASCGTHDITQPQFFICFEFPHGSVGALHVLL